jgi:hypothetical protein
MAPRPRIGEAAPAARASYPCCMVRVEPASRPRPPRPGEREQLLGYVARSRRVQGRLRNIGIAGIAVVLALVISPLDGTVALASAATVAIVVGVGFWITSGHIREWNERLREIERSRPRAASQTGSSTRPADPGPAAPT